MANIADYLPGGEKDPNKETDGIDTEINQAEQQQEERQRDPNNGQFVSTPNVDWETRYKELEQLNSRQAQDLGLYRKMVDEYITSPTSVQEPVVQQESQPITSDDLWDNPDDALNRAVESHPMVQKVAQLEEQLRQRELEGSIKNFQERHPDYAQIGQDPAFRNWVEKDSMRIELFNRGNQYDLSAADALFSLYKAENNIAGS